MASRMVHPQAPGIAADPRNTGLAFGALCFVLFGTLWLGLWASRLPSATMLAFGVIDACALALLAWAGTAFGRRVHAWRRPMPDAGRRAWRTFGIVALAEGASIALAVWLLLRWGQPQWIAATIVAIVGLHFLPLARSFAYPPHLATGIALLVLAIGCGVWQPGNPVIALGAGLVLWLSAVRALLEVRSRDARPRPAPHA